MQAPNVMSVAIIVAVIAALEALGTKLPTLAEPWVPVAVIVIAAIVKGLQVYLQQPPSTANVNKVQASTRLRRWLIG